MKLTTFDSQPRIWCADFPFLKKKFLKEKGFQFLDDVEHCFSDYDRLLFFLDLDDDAVIEWKINERIFLSEEDFKRFLKLRSFE